MRIRSIKPEFWRSDDIAALSWEDRLLFIGLWSYVDDNGVGRDNGKLILADLFALEDDPRETLATVSRGLSNLFEAGLITRYSVDGAPLLHISTWEKHQRIDKPNKERYEPPTCGNAVIRDTIAEPSRDSRETLAPGTGEQGNRGTGNRGAEEQALSSDKSDTPEPDRFEEFWETYAHKVDRKGAEQKWRLALRKPGVTPDLLIAAAAAYVTWERSHNEGGRYVMGPAKWLNGERWRDERRDLLAPRPSSNMQAHLALVQQLADEEASTGHLEIGGA